MKLADFLDKDHQIERAVNHFICSVYEEVKDKKTTKLHTDVFGGEEGDLLFKDFCDFVDTIIFACKCDSSARDED